MLIAFPVTGTAIVNRMSEPVYYELPEGHDKQLRRAWVWLGVFFGVLAVAVIVFILNAPAIVRHLPFSAEQRFVRPYEEMIARVAGRELTTEELAVQEYLQQLAQRMANEMQVTEAMQLRMHYVDSEQVNAFATLGGHIVVFKGLLEKMPDENSLAMVIGHEIGHVYNRDPIVSLGRGLALQVLYSFFSGDYSTGADMAAYGGNFGLLHFSREQERAADRLSAAAMYGLYGHVEGLDTVFRVMRDIEGSSSEPLPEWLSTHPDLDERIVELNQYAVEQSWPRALTQPIAENILKALEN